MKPLNIEYWNRHNLSSLDLAPIRFLRKHYKLPWYFDVCSTYGNWLLRFIVPNNEVLNEMDQFFKECKRKDSKPDSRFFFNFLVQKYNLQPIKEDR